MALEQQQPLLCGGANGDQGELRLNNTNSKGTSSSRRNVKRIGVHLAEQVESSLFCFILFFNVYSVIKLGKSWVSQHRDNDRHLIVIEPVLKSHNLKTTNDRYPVGQESCS
jgi:ABC-type hemin transport system ATPase subunit